MVHFFLNKSQFENFFENYLAPSNLTCLKLGFDEFDQVLDISNFNIFGLQTERLEKGQSLTYCIKWYPWRDSPGITQFWL